MYHRTPTSCSDVEVGVDGSGVWMLNTPETGQVSLEALFQHRGVSCLTIIAPFLVN